MTSTEPANIRCEGCGTLIPVPEDWRVVECPTCGRPTTRMGSDERYD